MTVIGIDPGYKTGAVAIIGPDGATVEDLPVIAASGVDPHALAEMIRAASPATVYVEAVHAMPKQGVSSSFNFGYGVGKIHAAVALAGAPMITVPPRIWKKSHGLPADKEAARARAIQLFPHLAEDLRRKKDADRAEALLIAAFGAAQ